MRLVSRFAVPLAVLAALAAGCGGKSYDVEEVPGPPVQLEVPGDASALVSDQAAAESGRRAEPTATPDETPDGDSGAATNEAPPADSSGGSSAAPPASQQPQQQQQPTTPQSNAGGGAEAPSADSGGTDAPPPPGSPADQFEDYCANNPGAC
jgi:hypothetical protein